MSELKIEDVKNLDQPDVKELLNRFGKRNEMNVVEVAEIISKLITRLSLDHDSGRPKIYTISGGHLGQILGIGKGVVSQFLSVWNMPLESRNFLRSYNLSLINAYQTSRIKGKDEEETIRLQKADILTKSTTPSLGGYGGRINSLIHAMSEAQMIIDSVVISQKIPREILEHVPIIPELNTQQSNGEVFRNKASVIKRNIEKCINYVSPKISKLEYLKKEHEFCSLMIESGEFKFCGLELTIDCLNKQKMIISNEILAIETEQKLPHIASLLMMKNNLEKNI
jgi:hypothetical protein